MSAGAVSKFAGFHRPSSRPGSTTSAGPRNRQAFHFCERCNRVLPFSRRIAIAERGRFRCTTGSRGHGRPVPQRARTTRVSLSDQAGRCDGLLVCFYVCCHGRPVTCKDGEDVELPPHPSWILATHATSTSFWRYPTSNIFSAVESTPTPPNHTEPSIIILTQVHQMRYTDFHPKKSYSLA